MRLAAETIWGTVKNGLLPSVRNRSSIILCYQATLMTSAKPSRTLHSLQTWKAHPIQESNWVGKKPWLRNRAWFTSFCGLPSLQRSSPADSLVSARRSASPHEGCMLMCTSSMLHSRLELLSQNTPALIAFKLHAVAFWAAQSWTAQWSVLH